VPRLSAISRRAFLARCTAALGSVSEVAAARQGGHRIGGTDVGRAVERLPRLGERLRARFTDLHRHFVFEYYPWYDSETGRHWSDAERTPPAEVAATSVPLLGTYDSRSSRVIEQHARWMKDAGVGAINLSWWGVGTFEDQAVHPIMDVMRAFDIKVMFHLEPYSGRRGAQFADDITYILREYGERRRYDALLLLQDAFGHAAPIFKSFVTLLSPTSTNCQGVTSPVEVFVPDEVWRQQVARVHRDFGPDFGQVTLVADSLDVARTAAAGFDAGAVGNPYIRPEQWGSYTAAFDAGDIPFAFAVNAGFDTLEPKTRPTDPCYRPAAFEPSFDVRWDLESSRQAAHRLAAARIRASFLTTLEHQTNPASANWRRGFLLVPINSFNEWSEGTSFEPMKNYRDLTSAERRLYHNAVNGTYRLDTLKGLIGELG
jgi:hypothetical protein